MYAGRGVFMRFGGGFSGNGARLSFLATFAQWQVMACVAHGRFASRITGGRLADRATPRV